MRKLDPVRKIRRYVHPPDRLIKEQPTRHTIDGIMAALRNRVLVFEIKNLSSWFLDLYKKHFGLANQYVTFNGSAEQLAFRRIIALCKFRDWPVKDFVEYNVLWYKQNSPYSPTPISIGGNSAELKYEAFLRENRNRKQEVIQQEETRKRIEQMKDNNEHPEQVEEAARQYADEKASTVTELDYSAPRWIPLTDEQRLERQKRKVWAEAKAEYMENWRRIAHERAIESRQLQRI
jgi:hypothetical protein